MAYVRGLEYIEPNDQDRALVMVAELETEDSLYAVERARRGLYALCKLGSWVKIRDLHAAALVARDDATTIRRKSPKLCGQGNWWDSAAISPSDASQKVVVERSKVDAPGAVHVRMKPPISDAFPKTYERPKVSTPRDSEVVAGVPTTPTSGPGELQCTAEPNAQESFDMIRCQYLEALYLSKVIARKSFLLELAVDRRLRLLWPTLLKGPCHESAQAFSPGKRRQWLCQNLWGFYVPASLLLHCLTQNIEKPCQN